MRSPRYAEPALTYTAVVLALSRLAKELMLNMKGTANSATMSPILCQSSGVQSELITGQPPHCCKNSSTGRRPRLSCDSASQSQDDCNAHLKIYLKIVSTSCPPWHKMSRIAVPDVYGIRFIFLTDT